MHRLFSYILFFMAFISCSNPVVRIENKKAGKLTSTYELVIESEKKFALDSITAPKAPFMQIYTNDSDNKLLTLLNPYRNSIYIYDYESTDYIGQIRYEREGSNAILSMVGYHIINMDSIYVYNRPLVEVVLTDSAGGIKNRVSLRTNEMNWSMYYPQYAFNTVCPIIKVDNDLLLTGFAPFSIQDSLINKFHFTACIDIHDHQFDFIHHYPYSIYGGNANWDDPSYMQAYPLLSPDGELIHSFPTSHDLYINNKETGSSRTVYAGSNMAKTITSIDWNLSAGRTPNKLIIEHYLQQDLYGGILYDPWRKIYYRFMEQGIPDATSGTSMNKKPIIVIFMDDQFNYLGETIIGTGEKWNWKNSFITEEGLIIEYLDNEDFEELYMNFKIFTINKI